MLCRRLLRRHEAAGLGRARHVRHRARAARLRDGRSTRLPDPRLRRRFHLGRARGRRSRSREGERRPGRTADAVPQGVGGLWRWLQGVGQPDRLRPRCPAEGPSPGRDLLVALLRRAGPRGPRPTGGHAGGADRGRLLPRAAHPCPYAGRDPAAAVRARRLSPASRGLPQAPAQLDPLGPPRCRSDRGRTADLGRRLVLALPRPTPRRAAADRGLGAGSGGCRADPCRESRSPGVAGRACFTARASHGAAGAARVGRTDGATAAPRPGPRAQRRQG